MLQVLGKALRRNLDLFGHSIGRSLTGATPREAPGFLSVETVRENLLKAFGKLLMNLGLPDLIITGPPPSYFGKLRENGCSDLP